MKLCFASNNKNKLEEIRPLLGSDFSVLSLHDIGCFEELAETQDTIEGNSLQKAQYVFNHYGIPCFADDTGLEVYALNMAPGVYSARYAGDQKDDSDNINLLLKNLDGKPDRSARFKAVITLIGLNGTNTFEGILEGKILDHRRGTRGFGYDPVFQPDGFDKTLAELSLEEKNVISHRGIAVRKLVAYLRSFRKK